MDFHFRVSFPNLLRIHSWTFSKNVPESRHDFMGDIPPLLFDACFHGGSGPKNNFFFLPPFFPLPIEILSFSPTCEDVLLRFSFIRSKCPCRPTLMLRY